MIRRLNYTGRRRIPHENIRVAIYRSGDMEEFDARVSCAGLGLPDSARLWVEAYHKSDWMRFDFGTVGQIVIPRDRRLVSFYRGARILFRVKAVAADGESGKILAEADRIVPLSPDSDRDRDPLLPVRIVDGLGSQIWRLAWESGPVLELNRQEPEIKHLLTSDPRFKWLVLPQVLRSVLIRILVEEMDEDDEAGTDGEGQRWLDFARSLYPVEPPKPADRDIELIENSAARKPFRRPRRADWRAPLRTRRLFISSSGRSQAPPSSTWARPASERPARRLPLPPTSSSDFSIR